MAWTSPGTNAAAACEFPAILVWEPALEGVSGQQEGFLVPHPGYPGSQPHLGPSAQCASGLPLLQVGCFLKTPRFPIWVVCSESHFSILFSLQPELLSDWRAERLFDLYYYDGLANQQEEIRLTVGKTL